MSTPVLILGRSGTGKSRSIINLDPATTYLIQVLEKDLPFKGGKSKYIQQKGGNKIVSDDYTVILGALDYINNQRQEIKAIVIDDAQYLMANEYMRTATQKGFEKFTIMGLNYWNLLCKIRNLRPDLVVFMLSHIETTDNNFQKAKTIGKMIDEKIEVEGMFTIVLNTFVDQNKYYFITQNTGQNTVKSPEGMFETVLIENDLNYVLQKIKEYE